MSRQVEEEQEVVGFKKLLRSGEAHALTLNLHGSSSLAGFLGVLLPELSDEAELRDSLTSADLLELVHVKALRRIASYEDGDSSSQSASTNLNGLSVELDRGYLRGFRSVVLIHVNGDGVHLEHKESHHHQDGTRSDSTELT